MRASHPYLLCALLIHEFRVVVFSSLQSLSLFLGNKLLSEKKRKDHCEMATDFSFAKHLLPKNAMFFFAFAKLPNHWLFWNSSPQNLTPIIIMEERIKTIQHVNQIKH